MVTSLLRLGKTALLLFLFFTVHTTLLAQGKLTNGYQHTAAIRADGTLWAWGYNGQGQLGNGTFTTTNYPVQVGTATNWAQVSGGYYFTMAIKTDGTLWAFGYNGYGQLGDGTTTNRPSPVQIGSGTNWVKVECGIHHTMAIKSDGTLWAWGYNGYGQLGDGTVTNRSAPVQVGLATDWTDINAGGNHTLGVQGGVLKAWGYNGYGQLGDGTTTDKTTPTTVSSITGPFLSLSAGFNHSGAVLSGGAARAWGYNGNGQLGDGTSSTRTTPVAVTGISTAVEMAMGDNHTIIRMADGTLRACGYNGNGQLGDGTTTTRLTPVVMTGATSAAYICGFYRTSGYIGSDPDLVCMTGDNGNGQIGNSTYVGFTTFTCTDISPTPVVLTQIPYKITNGYQHTVAIRGDGTLWAWGYNGYGQLGNGTTNTRNYPVQVGSATNWASVSAGYYHTVAIKTDGTLWAWGYNGYGQLGDGTTTNRTTPVQIGSATNWAKVDCGLYHTAALTTTGELYIWGYNYYGQLGDGTVTTRTTPTLIFSFSKWKDVSAGSYHTLGVKGDNSLWAWGYNGYGQLGDGTATDKYIPTLVSGITGPYLSISGGFNHSAAVLSDGTVRTWGYNGNGQLGDGTTINRSTPVLMSGISTAVEIAGGDNHTMLRMSDGTLRACGYNGQGTLGDGTTTTRLTPVVMTGATSAAYICGFYRTSGYIGTDPDVVCMTGDNGNGQIGNSSNTDKTTLTCTDLTPPAVPTLSMKTAKLANGYQHTVAIRGNGSLWAWGYNGQGQLGNGTFTNTNYPVQVGSATNWQYVSAGYYHTMAIKSDGTLWAWGYNGYGQLGDGTTINRAAPVQIGSATNWVKVECGIYHTVALRSDGTLWAWGYNGYGQLGDGTTTARSTPTQVIAFTPGWLDFGVGGHHTLAIKSDESLMAWGYNGYGQLGDGTPTDRFTPTAVTGITPGSIEFIDGGFNHSAVVLNSGSILVWGYNGNGQLGDGTTTTRYTPVAMSGISTALEVACGDNHTVIRLSNGTLRACGYNGNGQLGDGTTITRLTPVVMTGATSAAYICGYYRTSGYIGADPDMVCMTGDNGNGQIGNSSYVNTTTFTCTDISPTPVVLTQIPYKVTNGYQHTLAIRGDGTLWAWGYNGQGQLGNGTNTTTSNPVQVGSATNWASVSAGYYHTVGIKTDGTLWAWGYNGYGQLGDGSTTNRTTPVQIGSATNWAKVECGLYHTAALTTTGELYIWGYNYYGQVGDGTGTNRLTPTLIFSFSKWKDVSAGGNHTLGVRGDNTLWAWGYNGYGQLGDGTVNDNFLPVPVTGITGSYLSISAGFNHSAAVLSDGTVRTWGYNGNGQLGDGSSTNRSTPVAMSGISTAVEIASGDNHTMLRMSDGTLRACGYNGQGTLGDGTTTTRLTPVVMTGATSAAYICGFYRTSGYIGADPDVVCMTGDNSNGQIGNGTYTDKTTLTCTDLTPPAVPTLSLQTNKLANGAYHTAAIRADGTLWAWGYNGYGQLGTNNTTTVNYPVQVGSATNWQYVSAGYYHTMAIKSDGTLWAWGYNGYGQLGDGTTTSRLVPVQIGSATNWVKVVCGQYHTAALNANGTLYVWGYNNYGQIGDGTATTRTVPTQPLAFTPGWLDIGAGANHTLGVKSDGTLMAWGYNGNGQLGDGTGNTRYQPNAVSNIVPGTVAYLSGGTQHSIAVLTNGTVMGWGYNAYGQLGDGTTTTRLTPVSMSGISTATQAACGDNHTLLLLSNGTMRACGYNGYGQLGDGSNTNRTTPVVCTGVTDGVYIGSMYYTSGVLQSTNPDVVCMTGSNSYGQIGNSTYTDKNTFSCTDLSPTPVVLTQIPYKVTNGYQHTAAIRGDGTLWAWGYNGQGQLGNGTTANTNFPVQVGSGTNWVHISAGYYHTMGIKSDGTLWAWGYNGYGQLGDGTTTNRSTPVQIGSATNWVKVECGIHHTAAINANGELYIWGYNYYGQVGDGSTAQRATPTLIFSFSKWKDVSAGGNHTLGVRGDNTLWAWGYNGYGQLGDGTVVDKLSPVLVTGITGPYLSISAGFNHSAAVLSDGTARTWGYNGNGQLGDGSTTTRVTPVAMSGVSTAVEIASGENHTILRMSDGTLRACGYNGNGQLGDGTTTTRLTPVVMTGATSAAYICGFYRTSGYIGADPDVVCMTGDNGSGQIGNGTYTDKTTLTCTDLTPPAVPTLSLQTNKLANGAHHTAAIRADGSLWAWGYNGYGQLGTNNTTTVNYPVQVGSATNWQYVSAGYYHTMAIKSDGTLWAWGYNGYGQLGDGTTTSRLVPVQIGSATNWVKVVCGQYHTAALNANGTLYVWGYNNYGQIGDGTATTRTVPTQPLAFTPGWLDIGAGANHTLGVKSDGTLMAWGYNGNGQLGDGTGNTRYQPNAVSNIVPGTVAYLSGGTQHSIAVLTNGTVMGWGYNAYGQLGDGTTTTRLTPVSMSGISTATQAACGDNHTLLLLSNGTMRACGYNGYGQLGDGSNTNRTTPVVCTGVTDGVYIGSMYYTSGVLQSTNPDVVCMTGSNSYGQIGNSTYTDKNTFSCTDLSPTPVSLTISPIRLTNGYQHTQFVRSDGTLWGWGYNGYGQLGNGTTTTTNIAVQSGSASNWAHISAGYYHTVAIKTDGTLWAWGYNGYGQLGDGTTTNRTTPVQIGSATNWAKVECGLYHTAALTTTGELYIWGYNYYGQVGDGTGTNRLTPTLIFSFSKWKDVSAGAYHTLAVRGDNSLWAWGYNVYGQLGDGSTTDRNVPTPVNGITGPYLSISGGFYHSAAVLSDGTARTWGYNGYGQLGDGSTTTRVTPVAMSGISTAVEVAGGENHTVIRLSNGTLRACGYNGYGQLGDGTTTTRLTPVAMTGATSAAYICGYYRTSGYIGADPDVVCMTGDNSSGQIGDGTYVNKTTLTCTDLMPNIATNAIVGSPFCAGATVNVPFSVTYGPFNAGNVFTAQLSSSTGSFSSPVDIGTLSATTSGTIAATIPSNTPYGTAYRIRVVASDPAVEGTANSTNLMVLAAPVITSVVGSNTPGASIVINGTGFGNSGSVTLGGVAVSTSLWSNTSISATLPIGICGGNLEIINNCGFASSSFSYPLNTVPVIVSVTPANGTPGSNVTIAGTNFTASGTVTIGGSAMVVTAWNNTSVTATLPAGLCSGAIVVSNSCGSSSNNFSYTLSLIPTIVSVTPVGSTPGSSVTILGTNFTGSGTVTIGSLAMPVTAWTATSITATLPSGICSGAIVVTNSCGSSSSGYNYTLNVTPAITSVSPLNGTPGSSVTIDGINFSTSGTVTIGGLAMSVSTWTVTSITATLPFGICSGAIVITNSCGSSSSGFIYNLGIVPVITSVTPVNSLPGTSIVINGTGFSSAGNTVTIAGISATITAQSVSSITVNVPAGACNGSIVVANSCGTASAPFAHNASIASSVSLIGAPLTSCAGTSVNFTATPIYGGSSPMYQWKVNGNNQGIPTTDNTFSSNSLNDADAVSVSMTSSALCATPATSGSNTVAVTITPQLTWYLDADNDGYYVGSPVTQCSSPGAGYNTTATTVGDCNDGNPAYTTACPPVNDDCSGAIALTVNTSCIPATYATLNATNSGAPNPTCGFYQGTDVWFRILVPASGNVRVEVNGISGYNAQFAIYTGGCGNLTQYTCNQLDPAVTISEATLAGQTLYVRVYRYNSSASGSFNICAYEPVVPSNNNCVNATAVTVGATCVMSSYTNAFATAQPASIAPNPTCGFYNGGDVWFTLQMPASGRLRMEFINGTCNAQYALYSGTCGAFTQLVCSQLDPDKTYINTALSGQTLYLRVWNYNNEDGGTFQMCLWEPPLVPNDDCATALPLSVGTACTPANYSSQYATSQAVSVAPNPTCGFYAGGDVWFTLQMPLSGVLTINVTNIVGNAQFALYSGTCGSMTQVACAQLTNTMNISNLSLAGQTLYLRVFGFSSEEGGVFTLCSYDPSCLVTISSVNSSSSSCSNVANGSITISATCANCTGALEYSINSGSSYQPSPVFTGLLSGVYGVRVRDAANVTCLANYGAAFVNATATAVAYYQDIDNDSYGNSSVTQYSCTGAPVGYVAVAGDCNDGNNAIHPGATEICGNGIDEDCSGVDLACAGINTWLGNTTDWHTAGNWSNNVVPNSCASDVLIPNLTNDPIVISPVSVGNINLQSGTVLTLQATLTACGNWSGGSAGFSEAVGQNVILNGSSAQQISGETRFDKLNLTNPIGATLQSGTVVEVYDVLELQQGNLNTTGGTLRLLSTGPGHCANINDFGSNTGTLTGNVTAQRYVGGAGNDQHQIGVPVATTLSQLGASGTPGFYIPSANCDETLADPNSPYGTVFEWHENRPNSLPSLDCISDGWEVKNPAAAAQAAKGYSVYLNGGSTLNVTGAPNLAASYSQSGTRAASDYLLPTLQSSGVYSFDAGWNLFSNPFPSGYTYTAQAGFNANGFIYVPSGPFSGSYQPLTPGMILAPFQGIMLQKALPAGSSATYTFSKANRVLSGATVFYQNNNAETLEIEVSGNGYMDKTQLGFNAQSTDQFDSDFDLRKQRSNLGQPTIFTGDNTFPYAMNSQTSIAQTSTVDMGLIPGANGTFTFTVNGISSFDPTSYIYLEDKVTGAYQNLRDNNTYTFSMTKTENVNRFVLHFTPKAEITAADANCIANGQIVIEQPGSAEWQYAVNNSSNTTLGSGTLNQSNPLTLSVPAGIYTVTLTDNNGYVVVKQVQVNGSSSITAAGNSSTQIAEVNEDITFTSSTANAVTTVWNFGDGTTANTATATHNYAQEGTYTVTLTVTNADGCSSTLTQSVTVTEKMTVGNLETGPESWQVRVFPNPAIDKLFIELSNVTNAQVLITDVQGKRMLQADIQQQHYMVNVADWAAGIYLIKLNTGKHTKTIRVRVGQ